MVYNIVRFTEKELRHFVDEEQKNMSKEEQYLRLKNCDPTFAEYVNSLIKEDDIVEIDFGNLSFEVLNKEM